MKEAYASNPSLFKGRHKEVLNEVGEEEESDLEEEDWMRWKEHGKGGRCYKREWVPMQTKPSYLFSASSVLSPNTNDIFLIGKQRV